MAKIGLFGGTFNPIHKGHIRLADTAVKKLELDKLIIMPSNLPPHKSADFLCQNEKRFEMCRLAAADRDNFEVSDYELKKQGKSYSVYTVRYLKEIYPDDVLYMLVGSDMFLSFDRWFMFEEIMKNVVLCVASREEDDFFALEKKSEILKKYGQVNILETEVYPISSTEIRKLIKNNENYSCYLPEKVVQYIGLNNLYR